MTIAPRSSAFVRHAFWLTGSIVAVVIVALVVTLVALMEKANQNALLAEQKRLTLAIEVQEQTAIHELAMVVSGRSGRFADRNEPLIDANFLARLESAWHYFAFNSIYALDDEGKVLLGAESGALAGAAGFRLLEPMVRHLLTEATTTRAKRAVERAAPMISPGYEMSHAAASLIHDGFGLSLAIAVPANPASPPQRNTALVVAVRNLPDHVLRDIGQRYELANIRFGASQTQMPLHAMPILDGKGQRIGFLTWDPARPGSAMLPGLMTTIFASIAAIIAAFAVIFGRLRRLGSELATDEARAHRLAHHDHLSGLLNRAGFEAQLANEISRCERSGAGFALHLIDLDRFKQVNDTLGHQAGDEVIKETARRIAGVVRGADIVARLGGDEFGVIQINTDTTLEAASLAERLREAVVAPMRYGDLEIGVGCSLGIALGPSDGVSMADLFKRADTALYEAKHNGRGRYRFYEASTDASLRMKQLVEEELRDAIANDELELHYQPQVSADGTRILGLEALVRWRHPLRGMIPPLDFIPIAEQRGLIVPLGAWVIRRACREAKRFGLKIAVNLSAAQIKQPNFVSQVRLEIARAGIDPRLLELELTEGMIVEDEKHAAQIIADLRADGVSFALDDFGTGYSSLIYLRRFSFDKIKIDRSFLEAVDSQGESAILLHSVVHLGRALGLTVCAEGVETAEQHRFLQAIGCHELQGYHFGKPMPADAMAALLAERGQPAVSAA